MVDGRLSGQTGGRGKQTTKCADCPLRSRRLFKPFTPETLAFMQAFKTGEMVIEPGTPLLSEGSSTPQVYTALSGLGLRYKTLHDGGRQVISFVMPGDFIGLQAGVMGEMKHSVEATTEMTLCVFDRSSIWNLFKSEPERAFDLTWIAAIEEHFLGESLAALGQQSGRERVAWALVRLYKQLSALDLRKKNSVPLPYRQNDLADALGLSLVHTNKILSRLRLGGLAIWTNGVLTVPSLPALAAVSGEDAEAEPVRPLI